MEGPNVLLVQELIYVTNSLRIDTGGWALSCVILNCSGTRAGRILYYIPSERLFYFLNNDVLFIKFKQRIVTLEIYDFYFLNKD